MLCQLLCQPFLFVARTPRKSRARLWFGPFRFSGDLNHSAHATPPAASKSFDSSMSISNAQSSIAVGGCTGRISRFDLIFGLGKSATFG